MSLLHIPLLQRSVLEKLRSKNICDIAAFICTDPEDIAQITELRYKDVVSIRNMLLAEFSCIPVNGCDFYNSVVESSTILTTGIKSLDNLLEGGLYTGEVTEIVGDVSAGKTQICHSVCATTALQPKQTAIYIDTGAAFSATRVLQMLKCSSSVQEEVLSRIQVYDPTTIHEVFSVLGTIRCQLQERREPNYRQIKLIVLDNVASVVYPFLGAYSVSRDQGLLCVLAQKLKSLAAEFSVAVLVTNNLVKGESVGKVASLGRLWSGVPHVRLMIAGSDSYRDGTRNISVVKNSRGAINISGQITMLENGQIT